MRFSKRAALATPLLVATSSIALAQQVSGNAFNPAVSLILNGHYASYSQDPKTYRLPGFLLGDAGLPAEGLSVDETELAVSANVDDKYYGFMSLSIETSDAGDTSVSLEEAYFETLALGKGLKVKAGRFLSDIGYLNPIHAHAWDFFDAPLAYTAMLNGAYGDTGVQLSWVVPTDLYVQIGGEWLRGDSFPAANGADSHGTGAATFFLHVGGDVGTTSSWRAGVSYLAADANDRVSEFSTGNVAFTGSTDVAIADFVWKWAKNGNPRDRYYIVQAEYLHRKEDGGVAVTTITAPTVVNGVYSGTQSGFYVQGVYQFYPRWRAGLRYDRLDASNAVSPALPEPLVTGHRPSRVTIMSDFSNSEFSRMRLQLSRDESRPEPDDQIVFQYLMSLGAHGAHRF
jgi:hypothetical protein